MRWYAIARVRSLATTFSYSVENRSVNLPHPIAPFSPPPIQSGQDTTVSQLLAAGARQPQQQGRPAGTPTCPLKHAVHRGQEKVVAVLLDRGLPALGQPPSPCRPPSSAPSSRCTLKSCTCCCRRRERTGGRSGPTTRLAGLAGFAPPGPGRGPEQPGRGHRPDGKRGGREHARLA